MKIRTAHIRDADEIARLINSAYRGDSSRAGWTTEADMVGGERINAERVASLMREPRSFFLILENESELLGCAHLHQESSHSLYFGMLTVKPQNQARGLGRELLKGIEQSARDLHCNQLRLTVIQIRSELIAYYERNGFVLTGAEFPFPYPADLKIPGLKLWEMVKTLR